MSEEQPHPIIQALRKRAPDDKLDNWFWKIAAETGCSHPSIKGWIAGDRLPDRENLERLTRYFGVEFADEITHALYGWHVVENGARTSEQIQEARDWLSQVPDWMQPNVTRLRTG